jgi:hypothetical protein
MLSALARMSEGLGRSDNILAITKTLPLIVPAQSRVTAVRRCYSETSVLAIPVHELQCSEETKTRGSSRHFGLRSMEAHARRIGAEISIETEAGKGTHILTETELAVT